jgi:hypothetical protein
MSKNYYLFMGKKSKNIPLCKLVTDYRPSHEPRFHCQKVSVHLSAQLNKHITKLFAYNILH